MPRRTPRAADVVIVWRVWEHCSLSCRFCGFSRVLNRRRAISDPASVLGLGRVLADVQQRLGCRLLVSWLGGEPLDWPELPQLSRTFRHEYEIDLGITTNGLPLRQRQIREELLSNYQQLTVSLDGFADQHDQVRQRSGLFDEVRLGFEQWCAADPRGRLWRRVNTILMRESIDYFPEFCREMVAWGFDELTFNSLGGNERPEFYPRNRPLAEQMARFQAQFTALQAEFAEVGMRLPASPHYLARLLATSRGEAIPVDDCSPGQRFLFIDPEGRISPCSFSSNEYGVPLSQIRSVGDWLGLPDRFRELRRQTRLGACEDCPATHRFDKFGTESVNQFIELS